MVTVDIAFFLGGLDKTHVLKTFAPHIFFDDSIRHIERARGFVPSGLVPYRSDSGLNTRLNTVHQLTKCDQFEHKLFKAKTSPTKTLTNVKPSKNK